MTRFMIVFLSLFWVLVPHTASARLKMDDLASLWPRASAADKIDFTNRMGKAMSSLSPDLNREYFMRCLEETANIGDTKQLTMSDMVRTCISLQGGTGGDE